MGLYCICGTVEFFLYALVAVMHLLLGGGGLKPKTQSTPMKLDLFMLYTRNRLSDTQLDKIEQTHKLFNIKVSVN